MGRAANRIGFALTFVIASGAAAEDLKQFGWADLRQSRPEQCEGFLTHFLQHPDCGQQALIAQLTPSRLIECAPGDPDLDGVTVKIAGYAHPTEFEFRGVQSFLLIPPLRSDCRHPPPPLPDQIIAVEYPAGLDISTDPIWVSGTLSVAKMDHEIATSIYRLHATSIAPATIPEVQPSEYRSPKKTSN